MKTQLSKLLIFSLFVIALGSCKKDAEMPNGEFVNLKTSEATEITAVSAVVSAKAEADCTERGVCWGKNPNPTVADFHVANGSGKGDYTCTLTDLEPDQKYYFRAYGFDGKRYAYAKDEKEFVTKDGVVKVTTGNVTDITTTSATCSGEVTDDGGFAVTERGICWSTSPNPILGNSDAQYVTSGSGTGEFSATLTGLQPNTTYYVRVYAINSQGHSYAQDEKNFTTKDGIVRLTTGTVTDIKVTSATCSGNVTDDGGITVTERGFCWSTSPDLTLGDSDAQHVTSGSGTGEFSATLTSLAPNTTYYVRAYAINSQNSTAYGNEVNFTTLEKPENEEIFTANGVSFEMVYVEGGTFWMGAQSTNPNGQNYDSEAQSWESPVHQVTLSSYHIGKFEVTQQLWQAVMGSNPSYFTGDSLYPVHDISVEGCQTFIDKLNQLCADQLNGKHFALPTEAQWEYAARGGKKSHGYKYSGSNNLDNVAWYNEDFYIDTPHVVGAKQANELGLYDMSGNVCELCSDWYGDYSSSPQTDPTGPSWGVSYLFRGGCWVFYAKYCRVSDRYVPESLSGIYGLRLSLR